MGVYVFPILNPPHLPPHPIPLGHPNAPAPSTLSHASNLSVSFDDGVGDMGQERRSILVSNKTYEFAARGVMFFLNYHLSRIQSRLKRQCAKTLGNYTKLL